MEKTININLGGNLFQADEDAYIMLRDYIQAINTRFRNVPGGNETIEDIEMRIAEILRSKRGTAGVITKQNVEEMIALVGRPEEFDVEETTVEHTFAQRQEKRLFRNPDDKIISGVSGGLGAYFNTDPVLFRLLFILFTFVGFVGAILYLVLWIVLPFADTESRKREMYGRNYDQFYRNGTYIRNRSRAGSGINEIIGAIGKVLFVILRIFLILFGVIIVITGFLFILSFVMIFVFKMPGGFSVSGDEFTISYLPDFLYYMLSPSGAPWVFILGTLVFMLPMLALIYWGVKMIFWLKVRDGWFSLAALVVWIMAVVALSLVLLNEGVSFANHNSTTQKSVLKNTPDTLYVLTRNRLEDIDGVMEFTFPDDGSHINFIADSARNLYVNPNLSLIMSDDGRAEVDIVRRSSGRDRKKALENAESLVYDYEVSGDTLFIDNYFRVPRRWSGDFVNIRLILPEGTVFRLDNDAAALLRERVHMEKEDGSWTGTGQDPDEAGNRFWKITEEGLESSEE